MHFPHIIAILRKFDHNFNESKINSAITFSLKCSNNNIPREIAEIITSIYPDSNSVIVALWFFTIENTNLKSIKIEHFFSKEIFDIFYALTKLFKIDNIHSDVTSQKTIRLLSSLDSNIKIKVLLIRFAYLLHKIIFNSISHIEYVWISKEISKIYVPLFKEIKVEKIKVALQNACFKNLHPRLYKTIISFLDREYLHYELVAQIINAFHNILPATNIEYTISGRIKSPYSIAKKIVHKSSTIQQLYDIIGIRLIVEKEQECYDILNAIYKHYVYIPERYKNLIKFPRKNGYQSLHTVIINKDLRKIEVQIRTKIMHYIAEYGTASHSQYKMGLINISNIAYNILNRLILNQLTIIPILHGRIGDKVYAQLLTNEVSRDVLVQQLLNINLENKTFINDKVPDIIDEWNDNMVDNITFNLGQSKASTPVNTVINEVSSNPLESLDIAQESNIYANDSGILESDVDYVDNTTFNPGQSKASTPVNTVTNEVSRDVLVQQLLNINLENKTFINDKVPDIIDEWNDNMVDNITFNLGQSKASTPMNTVINEVSSNPLESLDIAQESNIYANDSGILESDVDYVDNTTFNPGQSKASIPMNAVTNEVSRDVLAQQLLNINLENKTFVNDKVPDIIDEWDENLPLHDAVKLKHKSTVELLLSQGAEVNQTDKYGKTPLHYAAESECKDIVELLLPQCFNINQTDKYGKTPLHYAAESGCKDIVELLLPQGVDVNILDQHYKTPLHYAAESGCKDIVELLLPQGVDVNILDQHYKTPLHYAAESGCKDIVELLLPQGVDVNILDQHYKTPLHYAAESGCKDIVELLLPQCFNINQTDNYGKTPLHYAAESGCKDIVELLLPQCFNINQTDNYGKTPLHYAAESGCKDIVELLLPQGVDVNILDQHYKTPLHYAAESRCKDIVELLLPQCLNINQTDKYGKTPLHYAAKSEYKDIVELLLSQGVDVNILDQHHETPLHIAVVHKHKDIVELLLSQGADVNIPDQHHETPLYIAVIHKQREIVELLLQYRSDPNLIQKGHTPLSQAAAIEHTEIVKYFIEHKDSYKILVNKVPIMKYYLHDIEMQKFLFKNGVIPEPEEEYDKEIPKLINNPQGVHNSHSMKYIGFCIKKLKKLQKDCINEINNKALELSTELKTLYNCKHIESLSLSESEKKNLLMPLLESEKKNLLILLSEPEIVDNACTSTQGITEKNYDDIMSYTPQKLVEEILSKASNILDKWLEQDGEGIYIFPKSTMPYKYNHNDEVILPELLGLLKLLIDREPNLKEKQELCVTLFERNKDSVLAQLTKIQEQYPWFTADQLINKPSAHRLLSSLDDEQISRLYNIVSNENINKTLKEQKLFVLAKAIYSISIVYGYHQEGCLVATFNHLTNAIQEIDYTFSDQYQNYLIKEQKKINANTRIDNSNVCSLVTSIAEDILKEVDDKSDKIKDVLQDYIIHNIPISSTISDTTSIGFEHQLLLSLINKNILKKIPTVLPNYSGYIPTNQELAIIIENLHMDRSLQKWTSEYSGPVEDNEVECIGSIMVSD